MGERKRKFFDIGENHRSSIDSLQVSLGAPSETGISATLRNARTARGLELRQVASALRIRYAYLEAIEAGRFGDLPGVTYAVGFIRTYADFLGLNGAAIVRRFKEELSGEVRKPALNFPTPVPEGRVPGGALLFVAALLAIGLYGGWYYLSATDRTLADVIPRVPERLAAIFKGPTSGTSPAEATAAPGDAASRSEDAVAKVPADGGPSATPPAASASPAERPAAAADPPATSPVPSPAQSSATDAAAPRPTALATVPTPPIAAAPPGEVASLTSTASGAGGDDPESVPVVPRAFEPASGTLGEAPAATVPPPAPRVAALPAADAGTLAGHTYGAAPHESHIEIRARQDSWVQVRDGNGELLVTRVLRQGDVYRVPDRAGLRLVTGNAGGLAILVDGVEAPSIGVTGHVLRDVVLNGPRLIAGTAVPN